MEDRITANTVIICHPAGLTYLENADKLLAVTCSAEKNRISKLHLLVFQIHLTTNVWPSRVPGGWIRLDKPRLAASHDSSMNGSWAMVQSLTTLSPIIFTSSNCRVLNFILVLKVSNHVYSGSGWKKGTSSYLRLRCRLSKTHTGHTGTSIHSLNRFAQKKKKTSLKKPCKFTWNHTWELAENPNSSGHDMASCLPQSTLKVAS